MHTHTGASVGRGCKAVCVCEEHPEKSNLFNEGKVWSEKKDVKNPLIRTNACAYRRQLNGWCGHMKAAAAVVVVVALHFTMKHKSKKGRTKRASVEDWASEREERTSERTNERTKWTRAKAVVDIKNNKLIKMADAKNILLNMGKLCRQENLEKLCVRVCVCKFEKQKIGKAKKKSKTDWSKKEGEKTGFSEERVDLYNLQVYMQENPVWRCAALCSKGLNELKRRAIRVPFENSIERNGINYEMCVCVLSQHWWHQKVSEMTFGEKKVSFSMSRRHSNRKQKRKWRHLSGEQNEKVAFVTDRQGKNEETCLRDRRDGNARKSIWQEIRKWRVQVHRKVSNKRVNGVIRRRRPLEAFQRTSVCEGMFSVLSWGREAERARGRKRERQKEGRCTQAREWAEVDSIFRHNRKHGKASCLLRN